MSIFFVNTNTLSNQNVMQVWIFILWCNSYKDANVPMMHMSPYQYANANFHDANVPLWRCNMWLLYDANFPCRDVNAKFIYDDANAPLQRCKCKPLFFDIKMPPVGMSWCECPLVGVPWCKCPLVGMSRCKCFLHDGNAI